MTHHKPLTGAAFVKDLHSQQLCLEDALRSGDDRSMVQALAAVADARGLQRLAADAGITSEALTSVLNAAGDHSALAAQSLIEQLLASQPAVWSRHPRK